MDNSSFDEASQSQSANGGDHPEQTSTVSAASLKAKLHAHDIVNNASSKHSNGREQNGLSPVSNHVEKSKSDNHKHEKSRSKDSSHHSSSSRHREHGSSSSSSHKDPNRHQSSSSSKHSSSSSSKHRDGSSSSSSKHKDHTSSSSSRHKDGSGSSSSSKHKDGSSSGGHGTGDKSRDSHSKEKSSSSSSSSDKHRSKHKSSSGHSSSSSHKSDRHKDGSKEHKSHKEHSSKHKDSSAEGSSKSKESSSSKHREMTSPKHQGMSSPSSKYQAGDNINSSSPEKSSPRKTEIKKEPVEVPNNSQVVSLKREVESDDDVPLSDRQAVIKTEAKKRPLKEESSDDEPLSARMEKVKKVKTEVKEEKIKKRKASELEDEKPKKKKKKLDTSGVKEEKKGKKVKKEENKPDVWRWWEEEKKDGETKWNFLEHKGPVFAELYIPLPEDVKFYYDGKVMKLTPETEEVGNFYARMLDHDYTTKDIFKKNFFKDWRKVMTPAEKEIITDLSKCNFKEYFDYYKAQVEERKNRTKEEKLELKKKNEAITNEYGFCIIDGHKQKIGNFKIEPPGLFRGRGDHPKQGKLKRRVQPEDVIINCSKNSNIPVPPEGHKWKEVRHDNKVTWLASWTENVQNQTKYVMLNAASRLKGEKDWQKYETARKLHKCVDRIRAQYQEDWKSKEMRIRQRAVALYFIDKLALRAGNEKDEDTADTVGCCSLRVEHLQLFDKKGDKECVVEFDFLGKDSIRYTNSVSVEKKVYKNLQLFMQNKQPEDDIFDRLNTAILNKHLHDLLEGLTAKVFRTYNASKTLQDQLNLLTNESDPVPAKLLSYNRANRAVAVLCNHQRAVPKNFSKQMENLQNKIKEKQKQIKEAKAAVKEAKSDVKNLRTEKAKSLYEKRKKAVDRLQDQLTKLEVQATDKDENKEIALGTSKLNYLDPRISVAWCKKFEVPIEKIYNKTQREKFQWAIDMAGAEFVF
ncbi:DNA topoisomerase I, mitochondrial-like [Liolophura sinensis]|uniref:DNA topoisomerase I, mitochondrial-like n=1 Tax=Liolophura sinensis TaxID=3198878 RepID=UPI0031593253